MGTQSDGIEAKGLKELTREAGGKHGRIGSIVLITSPCR